MRGLEGVRTAKIDDDYVVLTVDIKKVLVHSQVRKALPEKYAMGKLRTTDIVGTVDSKGGALIFKVRGSDAVFELREGELQNQDQRHPLKRLRQLWDDGMSKFVVGGVIVEEKDPKTDATKLVLEVTAAELPKDEKK